jgi:dienelactone hydrolase
MRPFRLLAPLAALLLALPAAASEPVATPMSFTTPDGFTIHGTLTIPTTGPKRHPVVILAHQFRTTRDGWAPLAERLQARGIATLALDLRGHGESADKARISDDFMASAKAVGFDKIPDDLVQASQWVRKQKGIDGRRVGLAGASIGGFSVLMAEGRIRPQATLALSPAGEVAFGDKALDQAKASMAKGGATLIFASSGDKGAAANGEALRGVPGTAVLAKAGDEHGFAYFKDRAETMAVFFGEYLLHRQAFNRGGEAESDDGVVDDKTLAEHEAARQAQQGATKQDEQPQ